MDELDVELNGFHTRRYIFVSVSSDTVDNQDGSFQKDSDEFIYDNEPEKCKTDLKVMKMK